jgi:flagellar basal-body rod modification protein FlgD
MSLDLSALGVRSAATGKSQTKSGTESLGQADFLTLLVTQLKNQDPLNPLDNEAFVAQLAQFSTVSGITEMNGSLGRLTALAGAETRSAAPNWLGRTVTDSDGTQALVSTVGFDADGNLLLNLDDGRSLALADVASLA